MRNSWSDIKKDLEENLLCDGLKGRVRYVIRPENKKLVYVKVDGVEREIIVLNEKKSLSQEERNKIIENGLELDTLLKATKAYKGTNLNNSLYSHNSLIRMLAIMDKRVQPKNLEELAKKIHEQPEWLQYFYKLRFEVEKIEFEETKADEAVC